MKTPKYTPNKKKIILISDTEIQFEKLRCTRLYMNKMATQMQFSCFSFFTFYLNTGLGAFQLLEK